MSELDIIVDKPSVSNINEDVAESIDLEVVSLEERANRIRHHFQNFYTSIINIGFELIAAKKQIGHGGWAEWLQNEFKWTQQTANNYMRVAERFGNEQLKNVFQFQPSVLIKMLELPKGDEQAFIEAQAQAGKPVENQSAREVQKSVKEWNRNKALKTSIVGTSSINEESTTPKPSEHNNENTTESEFTETNTPEENTGNIVINRTEEETMLNVVNFEVPQIQAVWELITKTDLPDLKPIQVELLNLMEHLTERMEKLHNEYKKLLELDS